MTKLLDASVAFLQEQLAALDLQRKALDLERAPIVKALAALREHLPSSPVPDVPVPGEEPTLAAQILDLLRKHGPLKRAQLVKFFREKGVNPSTLDSAVYRFKKRGVIGQRDGAFFLLELQPSTVGADAGLVAPTPSDSPPSSVGNRPGRPPADRPTTDLDPVAVEAAPSNRARVRKALFDLGGATRSTLVKHFAPQGLQAVSVDSALSALRANGVVERRANGVNFVVVGRDVTPASPDS